MTNVAELHRVRERISTGEPIRILIGERFYAAAEIVPVPAYAWKLRRELLDSIEAQIDVIKSQALQGKDHV